MNTCAGELMHRDLTAVMEEDLIQDAVHILYSHNLSGIPVVKEDWELVGYLSETDILQAAIPTYLEILAQSSFLNNGEIHLVDRFKNLGKKVVREFMTKNPYSVPPSASLMTVADLMLRKKIKRLPVVEGNKLIGVEKQIDEFRLKLEEEYEHEEQNLLEQKKRALARLEEMEKATIQQVEDEWKDREVKVAFQTEEYEKELRSVLSQLIEKVNSSIGLGNLIDEGINAVAVVERKKANNGN